MTKKVLKIKINTPFLFSIVVLCEIYIGSFRINFAIQLLFLLFLLFTRKSSISKTFFYTIAPIIGVFLVGFLGTFFGNYLAVDIIKDITHFTKPIIVLLISYLVFKSVDNPTIFFKTIINIALFTAIVHLIGVFFFSNFLTSSISDIRGAHGLDNFIEIFVLFFLLTIPKDELKKIYKNDNHRKLALVILMASILMYFSRTMLGMLFFLGISFYGYAKITRKSLKIIGIFALVLILFYTYLGSIKIDRNSKGIEALFYKIKIAPSEVFNAKIDRENHTDLWDHWRAYEAKRAFNLMNNEPVSYITGTGYGSLVNLKFKAPLSEEGMRYISVLHNGYVFILYKTGFFGIILYLVFLVRLYMTVYDNDKYSFFKILISTIGIYFLFTSIIITGIYIPRDAILFILGGALYHKNSI